jgi:antagonist of KipI
MAALRVLKPGMLTTVQDLGRWGWQGHGVPVAGPMDLYSHRLANRLAGNPDNSAALEITVVGPELQADGHMVCTVTGASFALTVDGRPVEMHRPFTIGTGEILRFGDRHAGARATLAVAGGFALDPILGSRATSLSSGLGPFPRALAAGDRLAVSPGHGSAVSLGARALSMPKGGARVRVISGPQEEMFTTSAIETLLRSRYVVTPASNRMGYRLDGPPLEHVSAVDVLSAATPMGTLQVPGSGRPILLMADCQTTGGYPRIATVITADLPVAGQLGPGDWIEFVPCTRREAVDALRRREARLAGLPP